MNTTNNDLIIREVIAIRGVCDAMLNMNFPSFKNLKEYLNVIHYDIERIDDTKVLPSSIVETCAVRGIACSMSNMSTPKMQNMREYLEAHNYSLYKI